MINFILKYSSWRFIATRDGNLIYTSVKYISLNILLTIQLDFLYISIVFRNLNYIKILLFRENCFFDSNLRQHENNLTLVVHCTLGQYVVKYSIILFVHFSYTTNWIEVIRICFVTPWIQFEALNT